MKKKIFTLVLPFIVIGTSYAQTWDGSTSTDWNNAANWSTNVVPTSTGAVIIPVPGIISNWPVLANNITIGSLVMNTGSQLNTAGFNITLASGTGCDITGAVVNNPVPANTTAIFVPSGGTNLNGNTFNGNFHFTTTSGNQTTSEAATAANTWNGNTTFTVLSGESLNLSVGFPSVFNGNLTVNKPFDATDNALANLFWVGGTITGNFTLNYDEEARLWVGNPGFTIRVGGQLNMNINNVASSLQLYGIKNSTTGGTVVVNNVDVSLTMAQDSFLVNTVNITQPVNATTVLDSNYIQGTFTFSHTAAISNQTISFRNTIFDGDASITTVDADISDGNVQRCYYRGNASFSTTSGSIILSNSDTSWFYKNLTVNANSALTIRGLKFVGNNNSDFTQLGTQPISIGRIIMEKTAGARLLLNDPVAITTSVRFTGGNIYTTATNYLRFNNLVSYTDGNDSSHVVGTVQKLGQLSGAVPFTFPVGGDTTLNPVTMSSPGSGTDLFSAEYLFKNPNIDGYDTSQHAGTLQRISACEYWNVQRLNGVSNVTLTFTFGDPCRHNGPGPLYITDPTKINIARWTGALWQDLGNGGSTGTTSGTVTTAAPVSSFSPFSFGSTDIVANPLPVKLLSFDAIKDNAKTKLVWKTTNEVNFSHFEMERSLNGINYYPIGNVQAINSSGDHNYTGYDVFPSDGLNYYRLKMIDKDGKFTQSHIVKVDFSKKYSISILPNPAQGYIIINGADAFKQIQVLDMTGKLVTQMNKGVTNHYNLTGLKKGMYLVRLIGDAETITEKLVIE